MEDSKVMIMRLQDNLSTIRKLGGWTVQELGDMIGVSKQTISNLENKKTPMTKLQYIGLRSVLDMEASVDTENAKILRFAMDNLLDKELSQEELKEYEEKIGVMAAAISGGASASTVSKSIYNEEMNNLDTSTFLKAAKISRSSSVANVIGHTLGIVVANWLFELNKK